ncbi:unnamed protein product [Rhizophagus irregularis]|nr:unnamed protein product [Rhizophagus irregularis]
MVKGGKLQGYCQTRWMTAFNCVFSVLRCEEALKNVGKGFQNQVCRKVVYWAIENIWIKMGGEENFSSKLIGQIAAFRDNLPPYNDEFISKYYTVEQEEFDGEDEDYDDTEDELVDIDEYEKFGYKNNDNVLQSENYFNFVLRELVELLKLQEPQVIIEPVNSDHIIDHGNKNFDIEELLDQQFNDDDNV